MCQRICAQGRGYKNKGTYTRGRVRGSVDGGLATGNVGGRQGAFSIRGRVGRAVRGVVGVWPGGLGEVVALEEGVVGDALGLVVV